MSEILRTYRKHGQAWADVKIGTREVLAAGSSLGRIVDDMPIAPVERRDGHGAGVLVFSGPLGPQYDHSEMD